MEFQVSLEEKDIFRFNMYHTYMGGLHGVFSIVIGLLVIGIAVKTAGSIEFMYTLLYFLFGTLLLIYMPISLKLRAKRQLKMTKTLQRPLHYKLDEEGITVSQEGESALLPWEQIYRIVDTKSNVLIYSNRVNAYIVPKDQLEEQYLTLKQIAKTKLERFRLKMK